MIDREKVIGLLQEMAEYFRECRSNASFASKAENHFWELQNAANEAVELLKEQEPVMVYESKISRCSCKNTVTRYWHPKFCGYCGKELMWY